MYDKGKIILGIAIFLVVVTFPIWYTGLAGNTGHLPDPKAPTDQEHCVESKEFMTAWHMDLLDQWRDAVVRDGHRLYTSKEYGVKYPMSLSDMSVQSCMSCHNDKAAFCDECHNYVGVDPYCWECHIEPKPGMVAPKQEQHTQGVPPPVDEVVGTPPSTPEPATTPVAKEGVE